MPTVLIVDKDERFLSDASASIRRNAAGWNVLECHSANAALEQLEHGSIDLVISNLNLSQVGECEQLLRTVAERFPASNRILSLGANEKSAVIENLGVLNGVLATEDIENVSQSVVRFYALRRHLASPRLREVVNRVHKLPVLPDRFQKLESLLSKEDYRQGELIEIVSGDPSIAAQVLRVGNSAVYARRGNVSTLAQAITLLGTTTVRTIVLTAGLFGSVPKKTVREFGLDALWEHLVRVGRYSQLMARKALLGGEISDQAFAAGLLHDIGKLVLVQCFPDEYREALKIRDADQIPLDEAEEQVFNAHHGEIGAYLLGIWNMPEGLLEAALYHHHPMACQCRDISVLGLVCAANAVDHARHGEDEGGISSGEYEEYLLETGSQDILEAWHEIADEDD